VPGAATFELSLSRQVTAPDRRPQSAPDHASRPSHRRRPARHASSEQQACSAVMRERGTTREHRDAAVQRYYDPGTGQFMSLDPLNQMTNAGYSFVKDNPFGGTDPNGLLFYEDGEGGGASESGGAPVGGESGGGSGGGAEVEDTYFGPEVPSPEPIEIAADQNARTHFESQDRPGAAEDGADGSLNLSTEESWGDLATLEDHFLRHGPDFSSGSSDEYAQQASQFLQQIDQEGLEVKVAPNGTIRIYDPSTNTFGSFNPDGTTKTFFKPTTGPAYWATQPGVSPWGGP
jgi:hypothetical protein